MATRDQAVKLIALLISALVLLGATNATALRRAEARREINQRREHRGCEPLAPSRLSLLRDARQHSRKMAARGDLFHTSAERLSVPGWSSIGEAIGAAPNLDDMLRALFHSDAHRELLLACRYDVTALGFYKENGILWLTARLYAR